MLYKIFIIPDIKFDSAYYISNMLYKISYLTSYLLNKIYYILI